MKQRTDQLDNEHLVQELRKHFTTSELDEAKEEIDGFLAESRTTDELVSKVRAFLDSLRDQRTRS